MNLIGLILIAALSGGIVVVSLRLRAAPRSLRFEREQLNQTDGLTRHHQNNVVPDQASGSRAGLYSAVRSFIAEARSLF